MIVSYHNHTDWSDGKATIEEQIAAARKIGLAEIGISDHYVPHPDFPVDWSMPLNRFGEYFEAVQKAAAANPDVTVRIGVEADFFPETIDSLRELLAEFPLDYVIGSVHYVGRFPLDEDTAHWDAISPAERNQMWCGYWGLIAELARSGVYDFVGHLDLPKKFGHFPTADIFSHANTALEAIADAKMAIEINTAGWHKPVEEAYPALDLLTAARLRGIQLTINADAHHPDHLTRDFDRARTLARAAGYTELVRFHQRQRFPIDL